jgi:hypothetical protein
MPWQQSKARPNRDAVDPYVSAQANSQSVRGLKYRFDKLTAQFQTILASLPTIDDANPIVPAIRSLEEQLAPLEATQQRIEAEIAAKSQSFMKLVRMRQKSLKLTVDQHLAGVEALGDAQPADPEWMAQSQKAMAAAVELMGMFLVFETPGLIT